MGVKDLWTILSPLSERKPLFELQGKAIAIDLSCWVVDSQSITDNIIQQKMHLRNLFFRTSHFLLHDIFPVFVLEGTAPSLKHKTIAKRNDIRHGREDQGKKTTKKAKSGRSRFNYILKECEEMLNYMGLTCVKGYGEAEAMCAYLNEDGLVDGCISQDSDCFLYGAKVVYRNFCTSTQGNRTTSGGSIDEYSMEKIEQTFLMGRNKMIALALLCGCDYDDGISGVGKEAVWKLYKIVEETEILDRLKQWRTDPKFNIMEKELVDPKICTSCGHPGKYRSHIRLGCAYCGTNVKCDDSYKEKRLLVANELAIRKKALLIENFPNQELIDEFLTRKGPVPSKLDLKWNKPKIVNFVRFMERNCQWEQAYAFAKILPLMTRWQLINLIELPIERRLMTSGVFTAEKIKKIRNIRSVASYEIIWLDKDNLLDGIDLTSFKPDDECEEEESQEEEKELVTIEPQDIVQKCYPNIVEEFEALRNAKKKKPTRSRKKKVEENNENQLEIEKKKPERKKRGKSKTTEVTNNKKIIDFVKVVKNREPTLEESLGNLKITPDVTPNITPKRRKKDENTRIPSVKKRLPQIDRIMTVERMDAILNGSLEAMFNQLTPEDFPSDVENSMDMSIIINNICNKGGKQQDVFVEYQENISLDVRNSTPKEKEFIGHQKGVTKVRKVLVENQVNITSNVKNSTPKEKEFPSHCKNVVEEIEKDIFIEHQESVSKDISVDEFDMLNKTYVPLDMRLCLDKNRRKSSVRKSLASDNEGNRCSMGIDSLLNGTD